MANKIGKWSVMSGIVILIFAGIWKMGTMPDFTSDSYRIEKYMRLAGECYEAEAYEEALEYLASALEMDNTLTQAYRMSSDVYLAQKKYEEAVQILVDGVEITGAEALSQREAYLREHIVVVESTLEVLSYDPAKHNEYFKPSDLYARTEAKYDKNGNMVKFVNYRYGKIYDWNEYAYDADGNQTKYVSYDLEGKETYREEFEYDSNKNLTKRVVYSYRHVVKLGNDSKVCWVKEEYDADGNRTKYVEHYTSDGNIDGWHDYEHDANGKLIKIVSYGNDGSVKSWTRYERDANGNKIKTVRDKGDGEYCMETCEYDADQNLIKSIRYGEDGEEYQREEFEYDTNGKLKKHKDIEYDDYGTMSRWREMEQDVKYYKLLEDMNRENTSCTDIFRYTKDLEHGEENKNEKENEFLMFVSVCLP